MGQHVERLSAPHAQTTPRDAEASSDAASHKHFEAEADAAAAHVMEQLHPGASEASVLQTIHRREALGHQFQSTPTHYAPAENALGSASGAATSATPAMNSADLVPRSAGESLPQPLALKMGQALGADLSGVRVQAGEEGHEVSSQHNALAVASGRNVFFRKGMYQPHDPAGRAMLAHELAHTVQQGAVPTNSGSQSAGLSIGAARLAGPQRSAAAKQIPRLVGPAIGTGLAAHQLATAAEQRRLQEAAAAAAASAAAANAPAPSVPAPSVPTPSVPAPSVPAPMPSAPAPADASAAAPTHTMTLRATPAFVVNPHNPMNHVFLTSTHPETGEESKIAERGTGRPDWQSVSTPLSSTQVTPQQLAQIQAAHSAMTGSYHSGLYGPGHNDCHTWVGMAQSAAQIPTPLSAPRFQFNRPPSSTGTPNAASAAAATPVPVPVPTPTPTPAPAPPPRRPEDS